MLVLSRKQGQSLIIGDSVVTVISVRGDNVRIGVEADFTVPVHREEVYQAIQRKRPTQAGLEQVADLAQRVIDPLGVAEAYTE